MNDRNFLTPQTNKMESRTAWKMVGILESDLSEDATEWMESNTEQIRDSDGGTICDCRNCFDEVDEDSPQDIIELKELCLAKNYDYVRILDDSFYGD